MSAIGRWVWATVLGGLVWSLIPWRREGPLAAVRWAAALGTVAAAAGWLAAAAAHAVALLRGAGAAAGVARGLRAVVTVGVPVVLTVGAVAAWRRNGRPAPAFRPTPEQLACAARLESSVQRLAGDIGERHAWGRPEALEAAARWIEDQFRAAGLEPWREVFEFPFEGALLRAANVVAEISGRKGPGEIVLVGAHYDTAPGTPGANDNASGVAVLLELAARLAGSAPSRTIRLAAFANEEPPFFLTRHMGSEVHAEGLVRRGERVALMISLETMGWFSEAPRSQTYPSPLLYFVYPHRGDFIALVGTPRAAGALGRAARRMAAACNVPARWAALPPLVPGVAWSDHWPFARRSIPAFMVTDTAPFRYPWYHHPDDLPPRLRYDRLAAVADGVEAMVRAEAGAGGI